MLLDRSYFALQAAFARRVADVTAVAFQEACRLHTAFYALARDNDAGVAPERNDFDGGHPAWVGFVDAVAGGEDPVDYVYAAYLEGDARADEPDGPCFTFAYWPEDRLVRIHFSNNAAGTALRPHTAEDRRRELRDVFETVTRLHPEAATVRGTSWLYHLEAYRRLFPPAFVGDLHSVGHPHQFAALWAQFLDRRGIVKPSLAGPFLAKVASATTMAELDEAFPFDVLAATSDLGVFVDHFA
jgi:hypothetical protein